MQVWDDLSCHERMRGITVRRAAFDMAFVPVDRSVLRPKSPLRTEQKLPTSTPTPSV
jgi:hypothetical protein